MGDRPKPADGERCPFWRKLKSIQLREILEFPEGPPRSGWAKLVPELLVRDIGASIAFWRDHLGFEIAYQRPEERFAYLERPEGAQVMLRQRDNKWETAELEPPYGRGAMFQVYIESIEPIVANLLGSAWPLHAGPREIWRSVGDREAGQREVFVQDPDGYLVMIAHDLGSRQISHDLPTFRTSRLTLRPRTMADLHACLAMDRDPEVTRFIAGPWADPEAHRAFVEQRIRHSFPLGMGYWSVIGPQGFVGWILLAPLDLRGPEIEIGWRLIRAAWGRGYATEAARVVLDHALTALGLAEVIADIDPANAASTGVARKLGMAPARLVPYRGRTVIRYVASPAGLAQ